MTDLDKLQDETLELIKTKKGNKNMKQIKAPKTYTTLQIIKTIAFIIILLSIGAFAGITIDRAISSTINSQVKAQTAEQVKSFTTAVK